MLQAVVVNGLDRAHAQLCVSAAVTHHVAALTAVADARGTLRTTVHTDLAEWAIRHRGRLSQGYRTARTVPVSVVRSLTL